MEGDTDGDIKKDAHITERKVAVFLALWEKGLKSHSTLSESNCYFIFLYSN